MGPMFPRGRNGPDMRGLILAGGKSSRFGTDKALAVYEGVTFLERAVLLLRSLDLKLVVVTRRGADYPFTQCTTLYDKLPEKGPLGGIYTAMSWFKATPFLVLTCDMPALTRDVLQRLLDHHEPSKQLTFYSTRDGAEQPFPGIYEPSSFANVRERLKRDELSIKGLMQEIVTRKAIDWKGDQDIFRNINSKEDLAKLS